MYIHFKKFSNNKHKDSDDFSFIRTFNGCFPAEDVCKIIDLNFSDEKNHVENIQTIKFLRYFILVQWVESENQRLSKALHCFLIKIMFQVTKTIMMVIFLDILEHI